MAAVLALLPTIFALIPSLTTGVTAIINFIATIRSAAVQSNQWTPALETQFLNSLLATMNDPAYQPDKPATPAPGTTVITAVTTPPKV